MPIDPIFTSAWKPKPSRRRYEPDKAEKLESFSGEDSIELQLGRSDFKLGELATSCPFPMPGEDAKEWHRGWLAEKQIETRAKEEGMKAHPYRSWASRGTRKKILPTHP